MYLKIIYSLGIYNLWLAAPDEEDSQKPSANEEIVSLLISMGFNHLRCQKAAINTSNVGVEAALTWLESHENDPGIWNRVLLLCKANLLERYLLMQVIMLINLFLRRYWHSYFWRPWFWTFDNSWPIKSWSANYVRISRRYCSKSSESISNFSFYISPVGFCFMI